MNEEQLHKELEEYRKEEQVENTTEQAPQVEPVKELSDIEKQAYSLGWRPKGDYSGEHYVEADEYVRRQPLFERLERQKRDITELRDLVKQSTSHINEVRKASYEQALRDIETKRMAAVEVGDTETFKQQDQASRELQQKMRVEFSQTPPDLDTPEAKDFKARNKDWYNTNTPENAKMKAAADLVDNYLGYSAQLDNRSVNLPEHLKTIEAEVKRLFPHRFPEDRKDTVISTVGKSTISNTSGKVGSLASKLSPAQKALGEAFHKTNKEYTLEMYAKDLEQIGRLGK